MRIFLLLLLFSIFHSISAVRAQNWLPVDTGKTYHYSCDTTNTIFSLWADSVKVNDTDTVFYTNRVILPCDTCHLQYYPGFTYASFMLKNQPLFLKRNVIVNGSGKIILQNPDTLVLDINKQIGNSWIFDTSANISASVYFKGTGFVLGVPDSLMGILLNSTDTIILSKNYGVIKWPCNSGNYFRLIGFEGADTIGYHVPDSLDIFDFHVGDNFYYEDWQMWPDRDYINNTCISIDSIYYNINVKKYQYKYYEMGHLNDYGWNIHTYWGNGSTSNCDVSIYTCAGINSNFSFSDYPIYKCRSFQDKRLSPENIYMHYYSIFNLYLENNYSVFEQLPLKYSSLVIYYGYPTNYSDIIVNTDMFERHHILIKEKQGLIENIEGFWEGGWGRMVTLQILHGDTLITPSNLCDYLNIEKTKELLDIIIYPNPTNDRINISGIDEGIIEIFNMLGQNVYQTEISDNDPNEPIYIDFTGKLNPGIYLLKVTSKEKTSSFKLFVNT